MVYKATEAAACVVKIAEEFGDDISPLKLQKILYYIQGTFLALKGRPAFSDEILAWKHGPAVHSVYNKYKQYGRDPIASPGNYSTISKSDQLLFKEIYKRYRLYTAEQLLEKTHEEPPWLNTAGKDVITVESIREYFADTVYGDDNLLSDAPVVTELPNELYDPAEDEEWSQYR